jgi:hypothetical protein
MEAVIQEVLEGKITLEIPERKRVAAPKAAPAAKEAVDEEAE